MGFTSPICVFSMDILWTHTHTHTREGDGGYAIGQKKRALQCLYSKEKTLPQLDTSTFHVSTLYDAWKKMTYAWLCAEDVQRNHANTL